jgi:hypothetical protein
MGHEFSVIEGENKEQLKNADMSKRAIQGPKTGKFLAVNH